MTRHVTAQRFAVEMTDGTEFVVRHTMPDRIRWDENRKRHGWEPATDSPFFAQTFVTWAAAKREGKTDLGWDEFKVQCVDVQPVEVDAEVDVIRPTSPAATSTSS